MFSPPRESRTKPHSQCFSPTWRGFHPLGGLPVHLFTGDSPKGPTKRCPAGLGAGSKPRPTSRRTPPPAPGRRTPARSRTSCPVSAASAASAPAAARRTPAARMATATGVAARVAARVTARVTAAAAARRAAAAPAHQLPPAAPPPAAPRRRLLPTGRLPLLPAPALAETRTNNATTTSTAMMTTFTDLTSFRPPKRVPRFSPVPTCRRGMPPPPFGESRLEQLQSFRAGWRS